MGKIEGFSRTDKISVGKDESQIGAAMDKAESFITRLSLDHKTTMRVRLLTEEVLEMIRAMVGEFTGTFWIEAEGDECRICVNGTADINMEKEKELLSASKDGTNVSVKGFSAKLSQFMRHNKEYMNEFFKISGDYAPIYSDAIYMQGLSCTSFTTEYIWSMHDYSAYIYDDTNLNEEVEEKRDELEKSIIASLADDVRVGVKGDDITLTVVKKV